MTTRVITSAVTMLVLIGLLVVGAVWGWNSLFAPLPDDVTAAVEPEPTCAMQTVGPDADVRADQVQVSVFNAGSRSGQAGRTLDRLVGRGFLPGDIGNAPEDVNVRRVQVWAEAKDDARARLVARQFGPKVKVRVSDEDLGPGVDVVVGNNLDKLAKAPRQLKVKQEQEFCLPVDDVDPAD